MGEPKVTDMAFMDNLEKVDEVKAAIAALEKNSEHPLSRAIVSFIRPPLAGSQEVVFEIFRLLKGLESRE